MKWIQVLLLYVAVLLGSFSYTGCRKDHMDSKYASQLQHKWTKKSVTSRKIIGGTFPTSWKTTALPLIYTREFRKDGKYEYKENGEWQRINGVPILADYEIKDDSVLLLKPPPRSMMYQTHRDTFIIRDVTDTYLVLYSRNIIGNTSYSSTDEYIDTLIR